MNQAYLFNHGQNYKSWHFLGSRPSSNQDGELGYRFAVWAPHAKSVSVVGDFNQWDSSKNPLQSYASTGIWVGFIPNLHQWERYKYAIVTARGDTVLKADPFARHAETRPATASILYDPDDYEWRDQEYMSKRIDAYAVRPLNIYEVHLGSWRRYPDGECYNYRDIAPQLAEYVLDMGYNAIELMPITEYPLDDSWGYQVTGYFAPTSRYGTPADLKYFVDYFHRKGIRVLLDWVPAHFPRDAYGLMQFDGEPLYEYAAKDLAEHRDWGTLVFDYSKAEVRSFLFSSACYWLEEFHFDGLRVDAVSSMLYWDFGREAHVRNCYGGRENLEAIDFIKQLNQIIRREYPACLMIAEESSSFPKVTDTVESGGLGFTHKWNMGWMNDTIDYIEVDYIGRKDHHKLLTFSMMYAFSENYILPFSHDEVVHGKRTLLDRMSGDYWRKFASLRATYMYQMAHPGAKLNFMGNEFAPFLEWRFYEELEWFMLQYPSHDSMRSFVKNLNHLYLGESALWRVDRGWEGFKWVLVDADQDSVLAFERIDPENGEAILAIFNFTPKVYDYYEFKLDEAAEYEIVLNSDDKCYSGAGYWYDTEEKKPKLKTTPSKSDEGKHSLEIVLPPLCGMYLKRKIKKAKNVKAKTKTGIKSKTKTAVKSGHTKRLKQK